MFHWRRPDHMTLSFDGLDPLSVRFRFVPVPVPGFLIQKSVLPSKNLFFYPGKIFLNILIFYKKFICFSIFYFDPRAIWGGFRHPKSIFRYLNRNFMKKWIFWAQNRFFRLKKGTGTELNQNRTEPEPDWTGADRNRTEPNRGIAELRRPATHRL